MPNTWPENLLSQQLELARLDNPNDIPQPISQF